MAGAWLAACALLLGLSLRMPWSSWLTPLEAQRAGQMPLVALRALSLVVALLALRAAPPGRRVPESAVLLILVCGAFAVNAGAPLFFAVTLWMLWRTRIALTRRVWLRNGAVVVTAAVLGVALALWPRGPERPADQQGLALYWEQRDNPLRALPHARAWAHDEAQPGDGVLCLARLARRLGDEGGARDLADDVVRRGDAEHAARARAWLQRGADAP